MAEKKAKARFQLNMEKVWEPLGDAMERKIVASILVVESIAVLSVSRGQPVRIYSSGAIHGLDPSAPGTSPKVVSGRLKKSITSSTERTRKKIVGQVGSNLVYARALELGYSGTGAGGRNVNLEARPYLRPSLRRSLPLIRNIMRGV
jgi:phage gpG-like protein